MGGRTRVEVTAEEAWALLAWARNVDGWESGGHTALWIYAVRPCEA